MPELNDGQPDTHVVEAHPRDVKFFLNSPSSPSPPEIPPPEFTSEVVVKPARKQGKMKQEER